MSVQLRTPTDHQWPDICQADGRAFGNTHSPDEIERLRPIHDLSRFRIAVDRGRIVGVAGSYQMDATMPGGRIVAMGGVTWVSVAATHRRQGLMRRLIAAIHDDIDQRNEPLSSLYASEGGIYHRVGYGAATHLRVTSIDPRRATFRPECVPAPGSVRFLEGSEIMPAVESIWSRFRCERAGEVGRDRLLTEYIVDSFQRERDGYTPAAVLGHADGYVAYRTKQQWNNGHPAHAVMVNEFAACTPQAHAALWYALLNLDLVGSITSRVVPIDDPLPLLLENPRLLRTTDVNDGVWVNVRNVPACFSARTYRSVDRLTVEADGQRWAIDGGPDGATCKAVKSKPDLITSHGSFSSLLYGGVLPSALVAGQRMQARDASALARADVFFTTSLAPNCQSQY